MNTLMRLGFLATLLLGGCNSSAGDGDGGPWDTDTDTDSDTDTDTDSDTDSGADSDTATGGDLGPYETCYDAEDCADCWLEGDLGGPPGICSPECDEELAGADCPEQTYGPATTCLHGHCYIHFQEGTGCPEDQVPTVYPGAWEVCWPAEV